MSRRRLGLVLAVALVLTAWIVLSLVSPAPTLTSSHRVVVGRGESAAAVAGRLERQGLIRSAFTFRLAARLGGRWPQVKQGTYLVRPGMSALRILDLFTSGRVEQLRLTVPEGWTVRDIGLLLHQRGIGDGSPLTRQDAPRVPAGLPLPADGRLEGYLFPDTYFTPTGAPARQFLAERMLARLDELVWRGLLGGRPAPDGRSLHQVLTLASLVEAEAKLPRERPLIAGVLASRLRAGRRLECDATVQYALGEARRRLTYDDLEVDSPYNTYRHAGLPPGPICNPGLASIRAALHPTPVPYLYYVARPDGSHVFTRSYQEHLAAIRAIRGSR